MRTYFTLEDPRRFTPEACEFAIEVEVGRCRTDAGVPGPVGHRTDRRNCGWSTTRRAGRPRPDFEARALYQLKFYALMIFRLRGIVPAQLKLIYLADGLSLTYAPTEAELLRFETAVAALWQAMTSALQTGDFPPRPSGMCSFCAHQALCPEFGGTPPPYPGAPGRPTARRQTRVHSAGVGGRSRRAT